MRAIWSTIWSIASCERVTGGIEVVRHPRARRLKLRVDPVTGVARLTLGPRMALRPALAWAATQGDWIAAQRARVAPPHVIVPGATLPFDGPELVIDWAPGRPRRVQRDGERLVCGGPVETLAARVLRWLRAEALAVLTMETRACADLGEITVAQVAVGDPRGRWGSCTGAGAIRYSWRLVMAPGWVRRAVVAHEVAHRVHMNHGAEFNALAARLNGDDPAASRAWLAAHGARLHGIGRGSGG